MKKADQPIHPCIIRQTGEETFRVATELDKKQNSFLHTEFGLTKREHFAGLAMQGILQNMGIADKDLAILQREYYAKAYPNKKEFECVAIESVKMADELLKELDKTK